MKKPYCFIWTLSVLGLFLFSEASLAQGKIAGHVKDKKTGEALIGVNIVILNTSLGTATDIEGDFTIVNVPVGTYAVQASNIGYTKVNKTGVIVSQGQIAQVDFTLDETVVETGAVTIVAERNIMHKEISSSQTVIEAQQISEAAGVNTLSEFLSTQAGITPSTTNTGSMAGTASPTNYLNIRGGNPQETGTLINGIAFVNARQGMTQSFIPTSSVEQVSLRSGGMTAEYGEFRSGIIDVTTKSGTKEAYHGSFSYTQNTAQMKRFGKSLYDPMNTILRPHLDPDIAFIGVAAAQAQGIVSAYDVQQFFWDNAFTGFKKFTGSNLPATWKTSLTNLGYTTAAQQQKALSPVDLFLFDAWIHQVVPDFDKLNGVINKLNASALTSADSVGKPVTDQSLIDLFKNHGNKEGKEFDYNFDGGFGGPIPFFSKALGDATFYVSNVTARTAYIEPKAKDSDFNTTTMLTLRSNIDNNTTLKLTGVYNYHDGLSPTHGGDSEIPSLMFASGLTFGSGVWTPSGLDRGSFLPEDNIAIYTNQGWSGAFGPPMWWYVSDLDPWIQKNKMVSANVTHAFSEKSYLDVNVSYQSMKDEIKPVNNRNPEILYRLGGILPLNEMPVGKRMLPIGQTVDTVGGWIFDQFYSVPGLNGHRFGGKGGVLFDRSTTEQLRAKVNFATQINKNNFVKAGVEYFSMNLDNRRFGYWAQDFGSTYEYNFKVKPMTFAAYLQDEISFEEMVVNIGMRVDYFGESSGLKWPTGRAFDNAAFGYNAPVPADWAVKLDQGWSLPWSRWDSLDAAYIAAGQAPLLQPVKSQLTFSPRLGIAFPITDRAKFYFNYGHFRAMPAYSEMYMYNYRYGTKGGLYNLGNPNLEPSRTIQYELGVDYNLLDEYLIHVAGYYKDITGEVRSITMRPRSGAEPYSYRTNDAYRDIEGVEMQITKSVGEIFTGWIKAQYVYVSSGSGGRSTVYQDSLSNMNDELTMFYQDPTRPDPVPQASANLTFKSPSSWGSLLGGLRMSIMPDWRQGQIFRYNPRNLDVNNEFRWPSLLLVNMGLSKTFDLKYVNATISFNVRNLLNTKVFTYQYAFAQGLGGVTSPTTDFQNYMNSLHLNAYKDAYYDPIRMEKGKPGVNGTVGTEDRYLYPGYVRMDGTTVGEDKVGDMRSSDKPGINDPNVDIFTYGNPRSIWFGLKLDF